MKNILLAGYYGFGNLGDEAILEMVLNQLFQITHRNNITVLSGNKKETSQKYNVNTIDRYNVFSILRKLMSSDALVFGGGSLLQDVTSKKSIYYYLFLIKLAHLMGNKVVMLSQGIGPIINERSRRLTAINLNKVEFITVRDKQSKDFLVQIGVLENKIHLSADPVINFRAEENLNYKNKDKKKVCFSLRNWKHTDVSEKISQVVGMLNKQNIECHFVPFYYNEDLDLVKQIENNIGDNAVYYKERLSTNEAYDIIKEMDLLVGVRLHSLIFAAAANVPFVAISYDHKVDHFVESVNMNVVCNINDIDENILYNEIIEKLENEESEKLLLSKNVKKLRETIKINYKILKEI
ncbi:MAG: polysaccharide pyruvyl transferase CsaB [Tissierellia bacterium]|nr:polysaccharide pyruvyl transferase CsaB [Tissierellia bacterium]MDD4781221.1 polysaccharide pyruvyl transferase CsaB [Tissierellia bacterium]